MILLLAELICLLGFAFVLVGADLDGPAAAGRVAGGRGVMFLGLGGMATTLAAGAGSAFADGTAASLAAAVMAGSLPRTPGRAGARRRGRRCGGLDRCGGRERFGQRLVRSGRRTRWRAAPRLAIGTGIALAVTVFVTALLGGTSLTVTVFTLTGVIGAFEPGAIGAGASLARGGMTETCALSAEASCGFAAGTGAGSGFAASATSARRRLGRCLRDVRFDQIAHLARRGWPAERPPSTTATMWRGPRLTEVTRLNPESRVKPVLMPSTPSTLPSRWLWLRMALPR